jgi:hypothetical protein
MKAPITAAQAMAHPAVVETINALAAMANEQRESIMSDAQKPALLGGCPFCGKQSCIAGQCRSELQRLNDVFSRASLRSSKPVDVPKITPPDGWEAGVRWAKRTAKSATSGVHLSAPLAAMSKAILDMDEKLKEVKP